MSVLVIGVVSLGLLFWTRQIDLSQRMNFATARAIMGLQIKVATAHLWIEEAIFGEPKADIEKAWSDLQDATRLLKVLLNGGVSEHGWIVQPLTDPELRTMTEDIERLLSEFTATARERFQRPELGAIHTALDERIDQIFNELQRRANDLETIVERNQAAESAKSNGLFFGVFLAWSFIVVAATMGLLSRERRRQQAEQALLKANDELEMRVAERTRDLASLNDALNNELSQHRKTEEALKESESQLRQLSARLLTAQETEQTRIAKELHDELGHALVNLKLRLRLIEKGLIDDQAAIKKDCEDLAAFIDQVVEDVRRLAREMSPSVLEALGLSEALRWLVNNSAGSSATCVVFSIHDLDRLFSPEVQIVVYRIIQEALTNIGKHAQATRVSLRVEKQTGLLTFVVEDDGGGFDVKEAIMKEASERGFGLATMRERARLLGGSLSVWSEEGKGSRITLSVPVKNGSSL